MSSDEHYNEPIELFHSPVCIVQVRHETVLDYEKFWMERNIIGIHVPAVSRLSMEVKQVIINIQINHITT
jgi:hypothetical protein